MSLKSRLPSKTGRGMQCYAMIIRAVYDEKLTAEQIAERTGFGVCVTRRQLQRLAESQVIHQEPGPKTGPRSRPMLWCFGPGPILLKKNPEPTKKSLEFIAFMSIWCAMSDEPRTKEDLEEVSGCAADTIRRLIRFMRKIRIAYSASAKRTQGGVLRTWAIGFDKRDAQAPPAGKRDRSGYGRELAERKRQSLTFAAIQSALVRPKEARAPQ